MADIEIKSTLLNDPDFARVKASLIAMSQIDHEEKFRVKVLEYINDSSTAEDDQFFFDMLEFTRFLHPVENADDVAFTTPEHLIYLNCPNSKVDGIKQWDFVYDHECLHQLWDTFGVAKKIKEQYGEEGYNHDLLNIASDCVINDYLFYYRKKARPNDLITPEYLKEKYNVEYERKNDTQFTLYVKLKKVMDTQKELFKKMMDDPIIKKALEDFGDRKLKPKSIQNAPPTPPGPPAGKHSDEFRKGWIDAIKDVLDGKVDPLKYNPKQEKTDYEKGYNEAMDNMKKGMEQGIGISKSAQGGQSGDLPQIPWDLPKQQGQSGQGGDGNSDSDIDKMDKDQAADSAQKSADKAKKSASNAKDKADKSGDKADKDAAKKAADAAKKAQEAADAAKDAADNGDEKAAQDAAKDARDAANDAASAAGEKSEGEGKGKGSENRDSDLEKMSGSGAADEAKKSAQGAQDAADKLKDIASGSRDKGKNPDNKADLSSDEIKKLAKEAQEAADKAKKASEEAAKAAAKGDDKTAKEKASEARNAEEEAQSKLEKVTREKSDESDSESSSSKSNSGNKGEAGNEGADSNIESAEDLEKLKKKAEETIKRYANKISGDFGEFIAKCKKSLELKESGLGIGTRKGAPSWNQQMNSYVNAYVKKKVFQKKREFKKTYSRVKRGSGFVKQGMPIQPGKRIREEKLTINVAFYIDRSGSMDGEPIKNVFNSAYTISEALKKSFGKEKVVDEISFKMFAFDMSMHELKWGNRINASGGTMSFDSILEYIKNHTHEYLINIIITDAQFSINESEVDRFIKDIDGMVLFITNNENGTMKNLAKKHNTQLYYVLADHQFTVK